MYGPGAKAPTEATFITTPRPRAPCRAGSGRVSSTSALDVQPDLLQLALDRQRVEAADGAEAGVVHQPVDGEPAALDVRRRARRAAPGRVRSRGDRRARATFALALDLARERLQPVGAARDQHDVPAVAREPARERRADAARRAGDEGDVLRHGVSSRDGCGRRA